MSARTLEEIVEAVQQAAAEWDAIVARERIRDAAHDLLEALEKCVATLTDTRIGQWSHMEGSEIYEDFSDAVQTARAAIAKATGQKGGA